VGLGLGPLGVVDLHATARPDGVKTGVGDTLTLDRYMPVAQLTLIKMVSAGASGTADLSPLG
jgi:hypothetical protein